LVRGMPERRTPSIVSMIGLSSMMH
jgi:hypothetical protein